MKGRQVIKEHRDLFARGEYRPDGIACETCKAKSPE